MENKPLPGGSLGTDACGVGPLGTGGLGPLNIENKPAPGVSLGAEDPGRMPPSIDDPVCEGVCGLAVEPPNIENKPLPVCSLGASTSG